jgi:probable DNA metabolism protein
MSRSKIISGNPAVFLYDGSFEGFLSVIFEIYASGNLPVQIANEKQWQANIFDTVIKVDCDTVRSERVWKGIIAKSEIHIARMIRVAFVSELENIEMDLYRYIKKILADRSKQYYRNLLDEDAHIVYGISRKVRHEIARFYGFVRFQETSDGLFFSVIEPDHNIVPLLATYFINRYKKQAWVIYDGKRDFGIYYDTKELNEIRMTDKQFSAGTGEVNSSVKAGNEDEYRKLWKAYYQAINIPERKNTRLMLRCLPRRYWKYLPEKQTDGSEWNTPRMPQAGKA